RATPGDRPIERDGRARLGCLIHGDAPLLPEARRTVARAETDPARILNGAIRCPHHARRVAGSITNATRIGDLLRGLARDRLLDLSHRSLLLLYGFQEHRPRGCGG